MIIAVDFDGTITESHDNMVLRSGAKAALTELHDLECELILWTCRRQNSLAEATEFLEKNQMLNLFSAINDGSKNSLFVNTRKILADVYIDDKNVFGIKAWPEIVKEIKKMIVFKGKTREDIISSMCVSFNPCFGFKKESSEETGMTRQEAKDLWHKMAKVYDENIYPIIQKMEGVKK